jgi:mono/diheme cytochrome c family protein
MRNSGIAGLVVGSLALAGWLAGAGTASATLDMQKKAKAMGLKGIENCQACHVDKMPKKGAAKVNDRGQWLLDQKKKKNAKEIDVAWLKDYTEPKK